MLSDLLTFLLSFTLFDDLLFIYTGISVFGKIAALMFAIIVIVSKFYTGGIWFPKRMIMFIMYGVLFITATTLTNSIIYKSDYFDFASALYEAFKLFLPFSIVLLALIDNDCAKKVVGNFVYIYFIFLCLNTFILLLQVAFGSSVVLKLGMKRALEFQFDRNRPTGITTSANIIGNSALFIAVFSIFIKRYASPFKMEHLIKINSLNIFLSITDIFLSTSKQAILLLLFMPVFSFMKKPVRAISAGLLSAGGIVMLYMTNGFGLNDKLSMYYYFISHIEKLNTKALEYRLQSIADAIQLFLRNFPFGTGLGTWGDFSSSFNPNIISYLRNIKADSHVAHLGVEHGVFIILYYATIYSLLRKHDLGAFLLIATIGVSFFSMGLASSTFPYIIGMIILVFQIADRGGPVSLPPCNDSQ